MKSKKSQINTDDETTLVTRKNTDDQTTAIMPGGIRKTKESPVSDEELKVIRSYWTSGSAALKRQAISRYAKITGMPAARAETALKEWVDLLERSK